MKRKLFLANLALLALCTAVGVRLRREYTEAREQEQAVLGQHVRALPAPAVAALTPPAQVKAETYGDIALKTLFSKDRNPVVVVAPPPPPKPVPMPALPLFHGVVDFGDGPMAIMSLGKGPHRDYQPGDDVGPFKLVAVNNDELVLEWDGKTVTKKVDEILDRTPVAPVAGPPGSAPAPAAPKVATAPPVPGGELNGGIKACQPGDTSPTGTVADGMRKVIKPTPFGSKCYWESEK